MNRHIAPPDFAMSFTPEAVLLEHRDGLGWRPLGQAPFAGREMTARLAALRDEAGTASGQADTVLVIPDDQILYTTLTVPVGSDTPKAIARALEAITPYQAEDLAFDWCPSAHGDIETLRIAAVARRTLEEAEDFARAQGFRPAGFVARPEDERFDGQPDFGPSRMAGDGFTRPPFSQPDLAQARVTDPVVPVAEPAAAKVDAPVVISRIVPHVVAAAVPAQARPAPEAAAAAVIRHKEVKAPAAPRTLPPRAQAVHDRAREARARPAALSEDTAASPSLAARLRSLDPGRLPVMMGILVLGLVLVLAFFGAPSGDDGVAPTPATTAEALAMPADPVTQPAPVETAEAPQEAVPPAPVADAETPAQAPAVEAVAEAPAAEPAQVQPEAQPTATAAAPVATPLPPAADTETAEAAETTQAAPETAAIQPVPVAPVVTATRPQPAPAQPDDALTQALTQAMAAPPATAPQAPVSALTMADAPASAAAPAAASPSAPASVPTAASPVAAAPAAPAARVETPTQRLASSARPPRVAPVRAAPPARTDARPAVPANPQPFAERARPDTARLTGSRPPERPTTQQASQPAVTPASGPARATPPAASSNRPPARPERQSMIEEGSRAEDGQPTRLTQAEKRALTDLLRDLRTAQAGASGLSTAERGALIRLADARPTRKPVAVGGPAQRAVQDAVAAAVADAPPARSASGAGLGQSARPKARPGGARSVARSDPGPGNASLSGRAIDQAVAEAVSESSPLPGAVALTALRSSALPPRRATGAGAAAAAAVTAAAAPIATLAPTSGDLRAAAQAQSEEAALAEQRRQDAELQAQAEARARARAAQDAQAEAQARAAAEARARAQAEAEARAAASRQQRYAPPEAEDEPEVAANIPDGRTPTTAGVAATVKDGIQINRTQIIGTIGAGKASRALVRLSNGRVLTLRLGDRINGGTITDIGDSRITFVKGGQQQALSVLGGR
ncbi:hypothetical protein GCM10011402_23790 [Paracoccus acridae]|uniref:Translation initiation factor 2 n=1 Tax=Paracoccus acridae TaxID=1795310 RepID=A0ABQ1VKG2_9RHOB|nr:MULTISPECIES: hypothetical protein [Paracoccus]GGF70472.1 hypothetical protein GCM10011402_23790 [Paracoccus acridae]